jgi:hypothetical protein
MIPRRSILFLAAIAAYGQNPETILLPPVSLAATETAQALIMSSAAAYVGDTFVTNCNAAVTFYGADGSVLGTATDFTVTGSRQIFSAELPYASTGASSVTAISAQIALTPMSFVASIFTPPIPPCAVAFSLLTYDTATGVTHAVVTGWAAQGTGTTFATGVGAVSVIPAVGQKPAPNIVLPPVGLGATETAAVNIEETAAPATPTGVEPACNGSVAFYDAAGSIIGASTNFTLGARQISSVKLPYASIGTAGANQTMVRAEIALAATFDTVSTPPCALGFSLETYDSGTGSTHALVSGTTAQKVPTRAFRGATFH